MAVPQPHILMCPPDFYGIHYEINPWMDMSRQTEHAVAVSQWHALHRHIINAGAKTSLLEPIEGLPDLVFTANAAMIYVRRADNPVRLSASTDKIVRPTAPTSPLHHRPESRKLLACFIG